MGDIYQSNQKRIRFRIHAIAYPNFQARLRIKFLKKIIVPIVQGLPLKRRNRVPGNFQKGQIAPVHSE